VSGAAIGVVGVASYLGAGLQDVVSGHIIQASKIQVKGVSVYDFSNLSLFWVGSAVISFILCLFIWNAKVQKD
jgi:OPA family sugar phosphate sensor protein UhpC-like MFS transporter